jgi:membrane protein YqaA with SNARE-associated domain
MPSATPSNQESPIALDRFVCSRSATAAGFAFGLAEATLFFIVPDLLLTMLACRALRPALKATLAALAGALIGGAIMFTLGANSPNDARSLLDLVPGINPSLIAAVEAQVRDRGLIAMMLGPIKGIPYKIYAVEWGARRGSFTDFLMVSIPARGVRFLLTAVAARIIARILEPLTRHRARTEMVLLALFWIVLYSFYFARVGW